MIIKDDVYVINQSIKLVFGVQNILIYKNNTLVSKYKKQKDTINDEILKITESYKINQTTVKLIELKSGTIIQVGHFGVSIYDSFDEFIVKTKKGFLKENKKYFFYQFEKSEYSTPISKIAS